MFSSISSIKTPAVAVGNIWEQLEQLPWETDGAKQYFYPRPAIIEVLTGQVPACKCIIRSNILPDHWAHLAGGSEALLLCYCCHCWCCSSSACYVPTLLA